MCVKLANQCYVCVCVKIAYLIVDEMHQEHPELIRDQYWDNTEFDLPYTEASQHLREKDPLVGSAMNLQLVYLCLR